MSELLKAEPKVYSLKVDSSILSQGWRIQNFLSISLSKPMSSSLLMKQSNRYCTFSSFGRVRCSTVLLGNLILNAIGFSMESELWITSCFLSAALFSLIFSCSSFSLFYSDFIISSFILHSSMAFLFQRQSFSCCYLMSLSSSIFLFSPQVIGLTPIDVL